MDTLYLDASAAVKLYIEEEGSDFVTDLVGRSLANGLRVAVSQIGYVEVAAAVAAASRLGRISAEEHSFLSERFDDDVMLFFEVLPMPVKVFERARRLISPHPTMTPSSVGTYPLRGYDATHLAVALSLRHGRSPSEVLMLTFDGELQAAAEREGIAHERPGANGLRFSRVVY